MAYKFQLGAFTASGSIKAEEGFDANNADINNVDSGSFGEVSASGMILAAEVNFDDVSGIAGNVLTDNFGVLDVSLASAGGLEEASNELQIKVATVAGLETDANGLKLRLGFASGLEISGSGPGELNVKVSGSSLTKDGGGLKINAGGVSNNEIASNAAIDFTKLAALSSGNILVGNGSNQAASVPMSGDIAITNGGATTIQPNAVEGSMLNSNVVDDSSIEISSSALQVKASGITNAMLAGSITANKMNNAIFEDLEALGAAASDGEFIVATGAGAFAYESGNTARTSLGLGTADAPTFAGLTVNGDLFVSGSTTTIETTELVIQDALIRVASGSLNLAAAVTATAGFEIGNDLASFKLNGDIDGAGLDGFASSLPISASAFVGDGSSLTGISADSVSRAVSTATADANIANPGVFIGNIASGGMTFTITHSPSSGDEIMVKAGSAVASNNTVTITDADDNIDGQASIVLESPYAAVTLIYDGTEWKVF